ncbi:MAG: dTMP kinase [Nanoarchaeota archaeon]|nr:dTMP kinase [Nanoarchaeota archaeon]
MKPGKFIVLEGINGCGKGTQLPYLVDLIIGADKSSTVFVTREPNDFDENGRKAREMLKSDGDPYENAVEAVGHFAKNRDSHNRIFVPMLEQGINVISDRYWHSNFAFQGAQGVSYHDIKFANYYYNVPDLTMILDVPVEIAFDRLDHRDGRTRRKFDSDKKFLDKVRQNYLNLPGVLNSENIVIINGNQDIEAVKKDIKLVYDSTFKSS